jgi:protease secretion system outer membrane protein
VRVTQAYLDALYVSDRIDLVQAQKRAYAEQMTLNEKRLAVGEGTRTDMLETQARYDPAEAQEIEAHDNLDAAVWTLVAMVGQPIRTEELAPLVTRFEVPALQPPRYEDWRALALTNNPELAALRYSVDAAQEKVERAKAGHLPRVSLYVTAGCQQSSSEVTYDQRYVANSVGIQISIPVFAGGGVSATVRQEVDNKERLRYENLAQTNDTLNELKKQLNFYNSSAAKIRAYKFAVDSSRELIAAMQRSAAAGERVNLDILDAEL